MFGTYVKLDGSVVTHFGCSNSKTKHISCQWQIQLWGDQAAASPIDQKFTAGRGCAKQSASVPGVSFKSLDSFLCQNGQKPSASWSLPS